MFGILRRTLRNIRYTPQRVWHPVRHRRLLDQLARGPRPRRILFICHGNICRSPYAAFAFTRRQNGKPPIDVISRGFIGPDRPCPPAALEVAGARGIDMSRHRSALVSRDAVRGSDLIVVMDTKQRARLEIEHGVPRERVVLLGDLDPVPIDRRTIHDPVEQPADVFAATYDRIDRCVRKLSEALS
jgi:protein-tyrosine phosphatase